MSPQWKHKTLEMPKENSCPREAYFCLLKKKPKGILAIFFSEELKVQIKQNKNVYSVPCHR